MSSLWSTNRSGTLGKICSQCKLWKSLSRYTKSNCKKDRLDDRCKICKAKYSNNHKKEQLAYRKKHRDKHNKYLKDIREQFKILIHELKCNGCAICGSYKRLEFHHINPNDKLFHICEGYKFSELEFIKEFYKCMLLCKKCHVKKHMEMK